MCPRDMSLAGVRRSSSSLGRELVSCASGPDGCIESAVHIVSDMAMSEPENTEGDRRGAERRFLTRVAALPKGVGLRAMQCEPRDAAPLLALHISRRCARVAAQVWGHCT